MSNTDKIAGRALRRSAANLRLLSATFETNAETSTDERVCDAWNTAVFRILDALSALEAGADLIEGVWEPELITT